MKHWIAAFRLKTLPLALGSILLGSLLNEKSFDTWIFIFATITALLLQILSNLANDYGDFKKGTDKHREDRQLAGGNIAPQAMLYAIVVFIVLTLVSGIYLLNLSFADNWKYWMQFFGLGIASIVAAIMYTVGKKAYGYNGLGDVFVFVFFGLIGVLGTSFLFHQDVQIVHLLLAISYGCLCVGVLNINNIRDLDKDVLTNKITLASKLGKQGALRYQTGLLIIGCIGMVAHHILLNYISLAPIGLFAVTYVHLRKLKAAMNTEDYNQQLKFLSLGSFFVVLLILTKLLF